MLDALKFVKGAVSKKDYQPALAHFRIKHGRVTGYNGTIALSSPIPLDIDAAPRAIPFVKAIERCTETTSIHITPGGKLAVRSGKFKAFIECTDESDILDSIIPQGDASYLGTEIVPALRALEPFIGNDASRPWATGVLFRNYSAYATNNIIIAQYWLGLQVPEVNLPEAAIAELIRIGEEPIGIRMSENSMTFYFSGDRWMRTQLLGLDWPGDTVDAILSQGGDLQPLPAGLFEALEVLKPFVNDLKRIYFRGNVIRTEPEDGAGAAVELTVPAYGAFNIDYLNSLNGVAHSIDFSKHPKPCPFQGDKLRGVIMGMYEV